jgi:hypothetical protein
MISSAKVAESSHEVRVKQSMKEVFSCFATHGEPPGVVRARRETALDRETDRDVLILDLVTDVDAGNVLRTRAL